MTDTDQPSEGEPGRPDPARPRPVREAAGSSASQRSAGGGEDGPERERPKPTPVRVMAAVEAPPPPVDPDVEQAEVVVGDEEWLVRVIGRSGGTDGSPTPLLLLGFWRSGSGDGAWVREALVVGRSLAEQTPASLARAFAASEHPPEPRPAAEERRGGRGRRSRRRGRGD